MPRSTTSSATSQSRRPTERSAKSASLAGKSQKAVPPTTKKSSKSSNPSPPKSALPPAGGSLYAAQQDATLGDLPPLPASIAASPAVSVVPLSRETTLSRSTSGSSEEGPLTTPQQATIEDPGSYQDQPAQPWSAEEGPPSSGLLRDETDDPPSPGASSRILDPAEGALTYSPQQTHRSVGSYSPALSRASLAYASSQHSAPAQYPYSVPPSPAHHHPHPHYHRAYHAPGPTYGPPTGYPHYYPLPSAVSVPPSLVAHHPSYAPQYHPPSEAYPPASRGPPSAVTMSASQLERQASGGSRTSTSVDPPGPSSPRGSTASADRAPAAEAEGSDAGSRADEPQELTQRIQNTMANMANLTSSLPDLHQLLTLYRETHGQLGLREEINRHAENQRADLLRQKDQRIDTLEKQLEGMVGKHSVETSKLRLAVGNLEEREKELLDTIESTELARAELDIAKAGMTMRNADLQEAAKKNKEEIKTLKEEVKRLKEVVKNAQEDVQKHQQELAEQTEAMTQQREAIEGELEASRKAAEEKAEVEISAIRKTFEEQLQQREERIEGIQAELKQTSVQEKEAMLAEFDKERTEWESRMSNKQQEHEQEMGTERDRWQQERDELSRALQAERESLGKDREAWQQERETLQRQFDEERDRLTQVWETKCSTLDTEHTQAKDALAQQIDALQGQIDDAHKEKDALSQAKSELQGEWDKERAKSVELTTKLQNIAHNLGKEKERLQKLVDTAGEVADIRSKGDSFYIDAFRMLSKQIVDLSEEHFADVPVNVPAEVVKRIPADLPSIMGDTAAARSLRSAYIQHLVSSALCRRIFEQFLLSLGRRHEKSDALFRAMSAELRNHSTRKEAVWRQHTLYAAYTSPTAKKATNTAAGMLVEEIVREIRLFTAPPRLSLVHAAVRRIVKLAAETWRYARLEREMITVRMPKPGEAVDASPADGADGWGVHDYGDLGELAPAQGPRRVLIGLLPTLAREPMHESLRSSEEAADQGCLYSRGVALFSDCVPVRARQWEVQAASSDDHTLRPSSPAPPQAPSRPASALPSSPAPPDKSESESDDPDSDASEAESEDEDDSDDDDHNQDEGAESPGTGHRPTRSPSPASTGGGHGQPSSSRSPSVRRSDVPDWSS